MDINYIAYKRQNSKIGAIMLIFVGMTLFLTLGIEFLDIARPLFASEKAYTVVYDIVYSVIYFFMFFVPVLVYKKFDKSYSFSLMPCELKLSKNIVLLILMGLGVNYVASYINALIVTVMGMDISVFTSNQYPSGYNGYNFVLDTLKIAIIPAFVEEFLFRGIILERLSRFGRFKAIMISSILFALMHQNPAQIIYTFILGLFLGYMVFESGSIWGGIILHFINNFTQVIIVALQNSMYEERAMFIIYAMEWVILILGLIATVLYCRKPEAKKAIDKKWMSYPSENAPERGAVRGFFAPTTIIFVIISSIMIITVFSMARL